jgi:hypothetical protein
MPKHKSLFLVLSLLLLITFVTAQQPDKKYLGRWDLIVTGDKEYPSWLELTDKGGKLTANFVGRWGNARPLPKAELTNGKLTFVSPKEEEDSNSDMTYEGKLTGDTLSGTVNAPKGGTWKWNAKRAPKLAEPKAVKWGKPVALFNGNDLTGWTMTDPNTKTPWKVVDGVLVSPGHGPEIINEQKFKNFKLHVEFNRGEQSNSGVYLRGRYEVQIENESVEEPPSHHTGGVYGFIAPDPELPRIADKWETFDITLLGRTITVVQDGKTVIDHKEIPGITGGALDSHEELPGPIYLQGSEKGNVSFRNITITPAEE